MDNGRLFVRDVSRRNLTSPRERHRSCRLNHNMHREPVISWIFFILCVVTRSVKIYYLELLIIHGS
jgi:hypothetical protein